METLWQDVKFSLRMLSKSPGFTAVAVLTLALGIGANTAMFSVIRGVLLKPLPYPEPERLITLRSNQSLPDLVDIRAQTQTLEDMGGVTLFTFDYTGGQEPVQLQAGMVTAEIFHVLGARALHGRLITPEEDRFGGPPVVVLSHGFWQRQFGGDAGVVGRTIPLSGLAYTVVGVMSPDFVMPRETVDVWLCVRSGYAPGARHRGVHFMRTYARLRPGVTLTQAQAEFEAIDQRLAEIDPVENKDRRTTLVPLMDRVVGNIRPALLTLFGAVGLVLLIACANFSSLLLSRSASRQHELLVRTALGAGRGRLIRQMLTESTLVALLGGAAGVLLSGWGVEALLALDPGNIPRADSVRVDTWVLVFTLGASLFSGVLFGLLPAWSGSRLDLNESLQQGTRGATAGRGRYRLRSVLVAAQLALALVLLVSAALLIETFWQLRSVTPGFDPNGVLTMRLVLPEERYREIPRQTEFRHRLLDSLNTLPGVQAAMVSELPLTNDYLMHNFAIEGRPAFTPGDDPELMSRSVAGDYFRVMRIPLLEGRAFTAADRAGAPLVGVVNEAFVRAYFPKESPLGARFRWSRAEGPPQWITIVGVVADVKHFGLHVPEEPAVYWPYEQSTQIWKRWQNVVLRAGAEPAAVADAAKRKVWALDPLLPVTRVRTLAEVTEAAAGLQRFNMLLLGLFAGLALALAMVGVYGVIAYVVEQRTREIGIRMALGAQRRDVLHLVLRQGIQLTAAGVVAGLGLAFVATRLLAGLLYGVTATDPLAFLVAAVVLASVALLACYVPAARATRVDPMVALRYE
jgi:putative ABC transport system permease protein